MTGMYYPQEMNSKISSYQSYWTKARITQRDHDGAATREEAEYYAKAAKLCDEIIQMNLTEADTRDRWQRHKQECMAELKRIQAVLAPPKAAPAAAERETTEPGRAGAGVRQEVRGTTKSGFHTNNATEKVTAEIIESWHVKERPRHSFSSLVGMEKQVGKLREEIENNRDWSLTNEALHRNPARRYFFYGPPGSGKTHLIGAFAGEMMDMGFTFLKLEGSDIHKSLMGQSEEVVRAAFQEAVDCAPCVLFIDEIDSVCANRSTSDKSYDQKVTTAFLEGRNKALTSGKRVIFIAASNFPQKIDPAMMDGAITTCVPLPSEEARKQYFEMYFDKLKPEDGLSFEEMADRTDNYSYRNLDTLRDVSTGKVLAVGRKRFTSSGERLEQSELDQALRDAIDRGELRLSREWFEAALEDSRPVNSAELRSSLLAYERSRGG